MLEGSRVARWSLLLSLCVWCACNDAGADSLPPYGFACNPGNPPTKDADGDGWELQSDCDDTDPTIHPGAAEACNGRDDNCNGAVDEYTSRTTPYLAVGQAGDDPLRYPFTSGGQPQDAEDFDPGLAAGDEAAALLMGDLDGDGLIDVALQSASTGTVAMYTIDCDEHFEGRELFTPPHAEQILRGVGDVDGDGDLDLVTLSTQTLSGIVWRNDGVAGFAQVEPPIDWTILDLMGGGGRLADSATLLDLDDDGMADWLMCRGRDRTTQCFAARATGEGQLTHPDLVFGLDDLEASSVALGYFGADDDPDLFLGLFAEPDGPDAYQIPVCVIQNLSLSTTSPSVSCPFDLGVEIEGGSLGFQATGFGHGWFRTVNLDSLDEELDELLIVLEADEDLTSGVVLLYLQYPLEVTPTQAFANGEIRPLVRDLVPATTSSDPALAGVAATAMAVQ